MSTEAGDEENLEQVPRSMSLMQSQKDEKRAKYVYWTRHALLLIFSLIYLIYQLVLLNDSDYNRLSTTSIDTVEMIDTPFIYARLRWNSNEFNGLSSLSLHCNPNLRVNTCNHMDYYDGYVYDSSATNWTVIKMGSSSEYGDIFILPPYGDKMAANETINIILVVYDYMTLEMSNEEYVAQMSSEDVIHFDVNNIEFKDIDFGAYWGATQNNWDGLEAPDTVQFTSSTAVELDILEVNSFGDITTNYNMNLGNSYPEEHRAMYPIDPSYPRWKVSAELRMSINSLHTKWNIQIGPKMTFLDVLAKTGGIYTSFAGVTMILVSLLLSGIKFGRFEIKGIAPNVGLIEAEKKRINLYLREIGLV